MKKGPSNNSVRIFLKELNKLLKMNWNNSMWKSLKLNSVSKNPANQTKSL
jgi:hypothetical protein